VTFARPCTGHEPLILRSDPDRCLLCGRYLEGAVGDADPVAAAHGDLGPLAYALVLEQRALRDEAAAAGALETPRTYREWLASRLRAVEAAESAAMRMRHHRPSRRRGRPRREHAPVVVHGTASSGYFGC
jgi:hypothetical protein